MTVTDQPFGMATSETPHTNLYPFDGIMGFAYPSVALIDNSTLFDRLYEQGQIKKRLACIKLHNERESTDSEVIIGGCNVEADYWLPVVRKTHWTVTLIKIVLRSTANNSELLKLETNAEAIVDSGGNLGNEKKN